MSYDRDEEMMSFGDRVRRSIERAEVENALAARGEPITVRVPRACELLGIGRSKLYELIGEREVEIIKVGSATLVVVTSLKAFVLRQRAPHIEKPVHRSGVKNHC